MTMFSKDVTDEEYGEFMYQLEKEDLIEYYRQQGWEKSGLKRFLINGLVHSSSPVISLELIKNDSELKLTEDEWEYARKIAFERLKKQMIEEYAVTEDEMDSDDVKEYFETMGFSDFVKNKTDTER